MVRQQDVEKGKERAGKPRQKGRAGEDVIGRSNWIESEMKAWDVEHDVVQMVENSIHQLPVSSQAGQSFPYSSPKCLSFFLTFPQTSFPLPRKIDCVYLYYCSSPCLFDVAVGQTPVFVNKVTDRQFRKASSQV